MCIMAAAISDFRPRTCSQEKIRRLEKGSLSIELVPNQDVASNLARKKTKQFMICFSLETGDGEKRAAEKMKRKGCDMMVYNSVESALGKETSRISLLYPQEAVQRLESMSKRESARIILLHAAKRMGLYNE